MDIAAFVAECSMETVDIFRIGGDKKMIACVTVTYDNDAPVVREDISLADDGIWDLAYPGESVTVEMIEDACTLLGLTANDIVCI